MRLLNAQNLNLVTFLDSEIPEYAILSHTWGNEEVTFDDMLGKGSPDYRQKPGFSKIEGCRLKTLEKGLKWFWIDTCCIDKSSSAELTEAINSMYKWYGRARCCFALLSDVGVFKMSVSLNKTFQESRWFTRGWTLQELLAPSEILFFDGMWYYIGTRTQLCRGISEATGIDKPFIESRPAFRPFACIALKLSWASRRATSREEDMAYCLMGLFDVNMPLLYGEGGNKAFQRLQHELIRNQYDHTIFVWRMGEVILHFEYWSPPVPILAPSPARFKDWDTSIVPFSTQGTHYLSTNLGILIELPILFYGDKKELGLAMLECGSSPDKHCVALPLTITHRPNAAPLGGKCPGISPFLIPVSGITKPTRIYLQDQTRGVPVFYTGRKINWRDLDSHGYHIVDYYPPDKFQLGNSYRGLYRSGNSTNLLLRFCHDYLQDVILMITGSNPGLTDGSYLRASWGNAALAAVYHPMTSWELLLRPNFDRFDFEQLKSSFEWSTTALVNPSNNAARPVLPGQVQPSEFIKTPCQVRLKPMSMMGHVNGLFVELITD